jgi:hypothetical protein
MPATGHCHRNSDYGKRGLPMMTEIRGQIVVIAIIYYSLLDILSHFVRHTQVNTRRREVIGLAKDILE